MNTTVRAYDLGGFGDVAGAMRVASHLQKIGTKAKILPVTTSVAQKLAILGPDVETTDEKSPSIQIDVAGYYQDSRNSSRVPIPHHFTEDMDNFGERRMNVPLYMKSGLEQKVDELPRGISTHGNPMFYRPYREWEIPVGVDARELLIKTKKKSKIQKILSRRTSFEKHVEGIRNIGFAHTSFTNPKHFFAHPYFQSIILASGCSDDTYGIGLFVPESLEQQMANYGEQFAKHIGINIGMVRSDGTSTGLHNFNIVFLGPQSQLTTTGLFVNSDLPNLVTGDLTLSDAMYALLAMDGQGFFYETPNWKFPTHKELVRIISNTDSQSALVYQALSNHIIYPDGNLQPPAFLIEAALALMSRPETRRNYQQMQRDALVQEIRKRFDYEVNITDGDFRIPQGAPFLIQDATAKVVETLRDNPEVLREVEGARSFLEKGVKLQVNVNTGVLEPEMQETNEIDYGAIYYNTFFESVLSNFYNPKEEIDKDKYPITLIEQLTKYGKGPDYSLDSILSHKNISPSDYIIPVDSKINKKYFDYKL